MYSPFLLGLTGAAVAVLTAAAPAVTKRLRRVALDGVIAFHSWAPKLPPASRGASESPPRVCASLHRAIFCGVAAGLLDYAVSRGGGFDGLSSPWTIPALYVPAWSLVNLGTIWSSRGRRQYLSRFWIVLWILPLLMAPSLIGRAGNAALYACLCYISAAYLATTRITAIWPLLSAACYLGITRGLLAAAIMALSRCAPAFKFIGLLFTTWIVLELLSLAHNAILSQLRWWWAAVGEAFHDALERALYAEAE